MKKIVFGMGRFSPPTLGHEFLINEVCRIALEQQAIPRIYIIDGEKTSLDLDKNPINVVDRKFILQRIYNIEVDIINTAYEAFDVMYLKNESPVGLVCGSDRVKAYQSMVKHSGVDCRVHGLDRDSGRFSYISGTLVREAARSNSQEFDRMISGNLPKDIRDKIRYKILYPGGLLDVDWKHQY